MSVDTTRYLEMERAFYSDLVARSNFTSEAFTRVDTGELVVGSYAQHERFDYERWLFGGVQVDSKATALEYGCGPGRMLLRTAPLCRRVDGVDISKEILNVARRRCARLPSPPRLFLTDGQELPAHLDGAYDLAFSVICLQHICVYALRRRILEGLYRALKPGGLLTFQMGYGPGHAHMVDYFADFVDAPGTNGAADVGVLHPTEIAGDLAGVGFTSAAYSLTPSGPGDTHGSWIFVRALKPGPPAAAILPGEDVWESLGFTRMPLDETALAGARHLHQAGGILARVREAESEATALRHRAAGLEDALAMARAERDAWRDRAADAVRIQEQLEKRVEIDERQLRRLRAVDRRRLSALVGDLARAAGAANLRVGVLGAGAHTEWLLRETPLGAITQLFIFDSDASRAGGRVGGFPVRPARELHGMQLDAVVVSSLAFQEEMVTFLESLPMEGTRIITCYP